MQLPDSTLVSFHGLISCTKGSAMYGEWLALHQVLAGKLYYTLTHFGPMRSLAQVQGYISEWPAAD